MGATWYHMPMGQCERLLCPESPAVMSFGFCMVKCPGALPGGKGRARTTVYTASVGNSTAPQIPERSTLKVYAN